ncbi:MAG: polysaccharide biosynthesis tyrosine autokinase [Oscillatoriophycideae cyanobacterium NC_groundwater_1537_Pr4_S-0.65um_50_18]|nr:polysaccharide biosynthesis tyrosine autokinase [Oscillatoriophycideae cyanobacterium NC_groundwater_1537_Pr4_S-0.65um_50_18]
MEPKDISEEIDIQKYWLVLRRRWLPAAGAFVATVAATSLFLLLQKPVYEAEGKLLIKSSRASSLTGLGEGIGQLEALNMQTSPLDTQAEIVRSAPVMQEAIKELKLTDNQGEPLTPESFIKNFEIKGVRGTDILQISYKAKDPELAASVVNKVIEIYIRKNLQANRAEAVSARTFIAEQLPETESAVRQSDLALRRFKEENKIIVLQEEASASVEAISSLNSKITEARAQLEDATAQSREIQDRVGINSREAVTLAALSQAPGVQEVLTQLQESQRQLAVEQTRYLPGYPTITNLERKISALNALLQERVQQIVGSGRQVSAGSLQVGELQQGLIQQLVSAEAKRLGLIGQVAILLDAQSVYVKRANVLPGLEQRQNELERKLQADQATYEALLKKLQEVQVAENQNVGNARIISPALIPKDPVSSRKPLLLAAGGIAGILLALATAFLLDLIDRSIKTVKEARGLLGYTLLGVIPTFTGAGKTHFYLDSDQPIPRVITRDEPRSPVSQAYQMLQANLKFLNSDKTLRTIVVTSSVAQEGKSEVSANLAVSIAQVGHRVLLVDADMRCPIQHHIWGLTNAVGLTNVMVDKVALSNAVQEVMPNVYVLPVGVVPPNPIALLDSNRMASLVATFSQDYDFIIFDTPPLAGIADAAVLGKVVDGILLVVRPGVINFTNAEVTKEFLVQSGQNVLGMVINGVNDKREPDSYFYYIREQPDQSFVSQNSTAIERNSLEINSRRD